jgi:asparagine synthase (glutamine-hydrolysing)
MINIKLTYNKGYKWISSNNIFVKGYIFTPENKLLKNEGLIKYFSDACSFADFQTKLKTANGLFSVAIRKENSLWVAIDHARSFPLFYYHQKDDFFLTDNPDELGKENIPMVLDENNAVIFSHSGFTIGNKTLLKDILQLQAGECLCYENNLLKTEFHTVFLTKTFYDKPRETLKADLKIVLEAVGKRMVEALNGRPVAIPLSGGFDSRLVAYLLKKNHYENVLCYTFGVKNNVETGNAKRTAANLGYDFCFIDYEKYKDVNLPHDPVFNDYADFASSYSALFAEQNFLAVCELDKLHKLSKDVVFISGNSGAVAGDLLSKDMDNHFSFTDFLLEKVFAYIYPYKNDLRIIRKEIEYLDKLSEKAPPYLIYEDWRFRETTTKFGYQGSKVWDFFGYEYLLPLADKALFDFFIHTPFQHKYDKNLYKELLSELFGEFNIYFYDEELYPSEKMVKKVTFRSKLKKRFPFLTLFINIRKNDVIGAQYYTRSFAKDLKNAGKYRKKLCFNGVFSEWYLMKIKQHLQLTYHETIS